MMHSRYAVSICGRARWALPAAVLLAGGLAFGVGLLLRRGGSRSPASAEAPGARSSPATATHALPPLPIDLPADSEAPPEARRIRGDLLAATRELVDDAPGEVTSLLLAGKTLAFLGLGEEAEAWWRRALEVDPRQAGASFDRAISVDPDHTGARDDLASLRAEAASLWLDIGRIREQRGDDAGRERALRRAVDLAPGRPEAALELASLLERSGRIEEAVARYEAVRRLAPRVVLTHLALGALHAREGRAADARRVLGEAIRVVPREAAPYVALARLILATGCDRPQEAARVASKAVEIDPIAPHFDLLGWARFASGDHAGAEEAVRQAIALDPDNPDYRSRLERLLLRDGAR